MISLANTGAVIPCDNYYIRHVYDGLDELIFSISIYDPKYKDIVEESVLVERGEQYIVKAIDAGTNAANIKAQLDLTELQADMLLNYTNNSATLLVTVSGVLPPGWACEDNTTITTQRTIAFDTGVTPLEVIQRVCEVWNITAKYEPNIKKVTLINPDNAEPLGAFASRDLNLRSVQYKGKSTELITRLYAYGKDGLSFASINDGKPYVENYQYTDRIRVGYWGDDRYTVAENLLADATAKLDELSKPDSSYECAIVDLAATNPELYRFEDFSIHQKVLLIDDTRGMSVVHSVVEHTEYPYYPEKNEVTLSKTAPRVSKAVQQIEGAFTDPNSDFYQQMQEGISMITNAILNGTGGNVVFNTNAAGRVYEILILDTNDIATARDVWRFNSGGLAHSSNGYNGPYDVGLTQDGKINASLITTGILIANIIKAGVLSSRDGTTFVLDLDNGTLSMNGVTLTNVGTLTYNKSDYTQADLTRLHQILLGTITPTATDYERYDFYGSGVLTGIDLLELNKLLLGTYGDQLIINNVVKLGQGKGELIDASSVVEGISRNGFRVFGTGAYMRYAIIERLFDSEGRTIPLAHGAKSIKTGTTSVKAGSSMQVTFSTSDWAFTVAPSVVVSWKAQNYSGYLSALNVSNVSETGFTISCDGSNPTTAQMVTWIAVGN